MFPKKEVSLKFYPFNDFSVQFSLLLFPSRIKNCVRPLGKDAKDMFLAVLGIRICMFLGLSGPDLLVRGPDPDPSLFS